MKLKKINKKIFVLFTIILVAYLSIVIFIEMKPDLGLKSEIKFQTGTYINGYFEIKITNNNFFPVTIYDNHFYAIMTNRSSIFFDKTVDQKKSLKITDTVYFKRDNNKMIIKPGGFKTLRIEGSNDLNLFNCKILYYDFLCFSTLNIFNTFYDKQINNNTKKNHIGRLSFEPNYPEWTEEGRQEELKGEGPDDGLSM